MPLARRGVKGHRSTGGIDARLLRHFSVLCVEAPGPAFLEDLYTCIAASHLQVRLGREWGVMMGRGRDAEGEMLADRSTMPTSFEFACGLELWDCRSARPSSGPCIA